VRPGNGENRSRDKHLAIDKKAIRRARPAEGREYYPQVPLAATENPCPLRRLPALARPGAGLHDGDAMGDPSMPRRRTTRPGAFALDATITYLAVWTRRDGRWELLAYQSARATP
jgi:hypothetical protein